MKTTLLILSLVFAFMANAAPGSSSTPDPTLPVVPIPQTPIPEKKEDPNKDRKRMPSRRYIGFSYNPYTEECLFAIPDGIASISVELEAMDGTIFFGKVTAEYPVWQISLSSGDYLVTCTANNGSTFQGYVSLE